MVEVTFAQLQGWLVAFLWPFARITAFMAASPLWGHSSVPNQAKVGLAALIAIVIAPILPAMPAIAVMSWAGLQMGLAFASFFDTSSGTNIMVLSRILYMITLLMFLAMNGHLMVLETLIMSFQTLPIGIGTFNPDAFILLARYAGTIFASGMLLALPLVGSLLTINLALGILNRSAPQLTVFNIGFPTSLIVGLILMMVLMTDISRFLQRLFTQGLDFLQNLIETMAPLT